MNIIPQTRDEKLAMYRKLTKRELAEMLINCNEALAAYPSMNQVTFRRSLSPQSAPNSWRNPNLFSGSGSDSGRLYEWADPQCVKQGSRMGDE